MKTGTPGFVPARLTEVRIARGLTKTALADCADISRQSISNYEAGTHSPQRSTLLQLAYHLNVQPMFFLRPMEDRKRNTIFWRSLASATQRSRDRALRRYDWLKEIVDFLHEYIILPDVNVPDFDIGQIEALEDDEPERLAQQARRHWGLGDGPIADLVLLLENNGVVVCRDELNANKLDAFSEWSLSDFKPYVVLGADKASAVRSRFDAAHELGHLCIHKRVQKSKLNTRFKTLEKQANRFAGAFLLPAESFADDFQAVDLDVFALMKERWRVSIAMMIYRCGDLNILSEEGSKQMWIQYARKGWNRGEPLDDLLQPEEPRLLRRSIELLVSEGVSKDNIKHNLGFDSRTIERLCNLRSGYLDEDSAQITVLPRIKLVSEGGQPKGAPNIHSLNLPD